MRSSLARLLSGAGAQHVPRTTPPKPNGAPIEGIPRWVASSVMTFLWPCIRNQGLVNRSYYGGSGSDDQNRDFLQEAERNLRMPLDWSNGPSSAEHSMLRAMEAEKTKFVAVIDFALKNIELGYNTFDLVVAAQALDRALTEAGSVWTVAGSAQRGYSLRRRVTEAGDALARQVQTPPGNASSELGSAHEAAFGREPRPGAAYSHAVKAVEAAAIPVVSPNNQRATLGTLVADMRQKPARFSAILARPARRIGPSQESLAPVEVTLALMDQLWQNQTDRHSPGDTEPPTAVTQAQAEWAVHTACLLVQIFRSNWVR